MSGPWHITDKERYSINPAKWDSVRLSYRCSNPDQVQNSITLFVGLYGDLVEIKPPKLQNGSEVKDVRGLTLADILKNDGLNGMLQPFQPAPSRPPLVAKQFTGISLVPDDPNVIIVNYTSPEDLIRIECKLLGDLLIVKRAGGTGKKTVQGITISDVLEDLRHSLKIRFPQSKNSDRKNRGSISRFQNVIDNFLNSAPKQIPGPRSKRTVSPHKSNAANVLALGGGR